jgi:hypothetical protein
LVDLNPTQRDKRDASGLRRTVREYIKAHRNDITVDPYAIASAVLDQLSEYESQIAAHLQLRQIARALLRHEFEFEGETNEQSEAQPASAFSKPKLKLSHEDARQPDIPNLLQDRYPRADGGGYIQREKMSDLDWRYNLAGLAKDIAGKQAHYEALLQWGEAKGWLVNAALEKAPDV